MASEQKILDALSHVSDPETGKDITSSGMVSGVQVSDDGAVVFSIEVDPARGAALESLRQNAEAVVMKLSGVSKVTAVLTAEKTAAARTRTPQSSAPDPHGMNKNPKLDLPVRHIIAVASGKGGVGKSTVAANLAISLAKNDQKIGLLDADIYGPSQPRMMGLSGQKPGGNSTVIEPLEAHGIKVMSIGFMIDEEKALVWRGPMVQSAIYQMLRDVNWGSAEEPLDILVVDMPPGTGDAQLTMAQKVPLAGAVIVSTPQDIALLDARRGIEMFGAVNVPVLGVIENMSTHICSECGHEEHIFGHDGARKEAEARGVDFLGGIPLERDIRLNSDDGAPIVSAQPDGDVSKTFDGIAQRVIKALN